MAVQPLSPATDRRLGEPLPHQLSNRTQAHPPAIISLMVASCEAAISYGISNCFRLLSRTGGQIAHALLTRPPLNSPPKETIPFDLNVLCTPPALILSQDQTL